MARSVGGTGMEPRPRTLPRDRPECRVVSHRASCVPLPGRRTALPGAAALLVGAACSWRDAFAAHVVRAWPAGRPVPPLDLVDLGGKRWRLDGLAGDVVVLN